MTIPRTDPFTNGGGGGSSGAALRGGVSPNTGTGGGGGWTLTGGIEYIYDGNRVIQERDTNNTPTVSYTRGNDLSGTLEGAGGIGGLLARSGNFYSGNFTNHNFYHADGNGNITYLENASQGLAASYRYDPYGNLASSGGTLATTNSYRFSSKEYVSAAGTGFYYYLYRFYSPSWQRWLNRDPLAELGGLNLYCYVYNNPIDSLDPIGTEPQMPGRNETGQPTTDGNSKADDKSCGDRASNADPTGRKDRPKQPKIPVPPPEKRPEHNVNPNPPPGSITPPKDYLPPPIYIPPTPYVPNYNLVSAYQPGFTPPETLTLSGLLVLGGIWAGSTILAEPVK